jgi:hypothetical protein
MSKTCGICQGFIADWILLPLREGEGETAFIKPKSLHAHAGEIARQLFAIYARIPHTYREFIECGQVGYLRTLVYTYNRNNMCEMAFAQMIQEGADGECLLQALEMFTGKEEIEILQEMLEDRCTRKKGAARRWIGQAFVKLWDILHEIHMEHLGIIQTSNGGAAHGLRTCVRIQGKMYLCPPVYRASIHSLVEISGGFLLVKEPAASAEEDLYA